MSLPGKIESNPIFTKTFRYEAAASEAKDADLVTWASLQNLMFTASSGTTGLALFGAVRLRRIDLWATANGTSSGMLTAAITLLGDRSVNRSVQGAGTLTSPIHLSLKPKRGSFHDMWFSGANAVPSYGSSSPFCFSLSGPSSSIVDVTVSFQIIDASSNEDTNAVTTAGTTAGFVYTNQYLDNTSAALGNGTKNWTVSQVSSVGTGYISTW